MAMNFSFVCFLSTSIHIRLHIIPFLCINYRKIYDKLPSQKIIKFILHLTKKKKKDFLRDQKLNPQVFPRVL